MHFQEEDGVDSLKVGLGAAFRDHSSVWRTKHVTCNS